MDRKSPIWVALLRTHSGSIYGCSDKYILTTQTVDKSEGIHAHLPKCRLPISSRICHRTKQSLQI